MPHPPREAPTGVSYQQLAKDIKERFWNFLEPTFSSWPCEHGAHVAASKVIFSKTTKQPSVGLDYRRLLVDMLKILQKEEEYVCVNVAMWLAVMENHKEALASFLHHQKFSSSILYPYITYAARFSELSILKILLEHDRDKGFKKDQLLDAVMKSGKTDKVNYVLDRRHYGRTKMTYHIKYAAEFCELPILKILLKHNRSKGFFNDLLLRAVMKSGNTDKVSYVLNTPRYDNGSIDSQIDYAARYCKLHILKMFLEHEKSKHFDDYDALVKIAMESCEADKLIYLLDKGKIVLGQDKNKDFDNHQSLMEVFTGSEDVDKLSYLLDTRRYDDRIVSYIKLAARFHGLPVFKILLEHDKSEYFAQCDKYIGLLEIVMERNKTDKLSYLLDAGRYHANMKDRAGYTPLTLAVKQGKKNLVKYLVAAEAVQVDLQNGNSLITPLTEAISSGQEDMAAILLHSGRLDLNARDGLWRWTPLMNAARWDARLVVGMLLGAGAGAVDVNARDARHGRTALMIAAASGSNAAVKLLLDHGDVDADLVDDAGWGALFHAAGNGHWATVELLLETGRFDMEQRDAEGETALEVASQHESKGGLGVMLRWKNKAALRHVRKMEYRGKRMGRTAKDYSDP